MSRPYIVPPHRKAVIREFQAEIALASDRTIDSLIESLRHHYESHHDPHGECASCEFWEKL